MILLILALLILLVFLCIRKENFSGALTQLFAKGPQDTYMIGNDAYRYYFYPWYPQFIWNNPTRFTYYYNPYYRRFPYTYGYTFPQYYPPYY